ncbi:MAG TPA: hypothetical protein DCR27_04795 [Lachnospiraceae bacterium]|nr:hypothetical protein [Lachnospiraceae bacterium]
MQKIHILTFWAVPNYGAFAQAYALSQVVRLIKPDAEVKHIAYLHPKHINLYFGKKIPKPHNAKDFIRLSYYRNWIRYFTGSAPTYPHFAKAWNAIPHIDIASPDILEKMQWDILITGSDAIWEYSIKAFGDDVHLIGNRMKCRRLISYAASFGDMNTGDHFPDFVKSGLEKYDALSVRDLSSYEIVCEQLQRNAECPIVLDPSLLFNFQQDKGIPAPPYERYILVYGNSFPAPLVEEVKLYARQKGLHIIGAGLAPEWCDMRLTDIEPTAWIGMFSKADLVVTCTFHGLMFSLSYNRTVVFCPIAYVKNRSRWLLSQLGLDALYRTDTTLAEVLEYEWEWECINDRLHKLRDSSLSFLKKVLANEKYI